MKTYDEISKRVLERRDEYITEQKVKRKKLIQMSSALGCTLIVVGMGFGYGHWERKPAGDPLGGESVINTTATMATTYITGGASTDNMTEDATLTEPTTDVSQVIPQMTTSPTTLPDIDMTENLTTTRPGNYTTDNITTTIPVELWPEIDWDRKSLPGKFCSVVLEREEYDCFGEYVYPFSATEEQASTRKATKIVSDKLIEQYTPDGKVHAVYADLFSLEGFSEELVIGVKFSGDDRIFPYINVFYQPETLGELLEAIDYDNTVSFGSMTLYRGTNFPVNDKNAKDIKDYLLSDSESKNLGDLTVSDNCVTASIYCRELGIENKSFRISKDGYITTNIIGYQYVFYVGKEKTADFLKNSYNITFEQIKEMRSNTTTAPLVTESETTVSENAVVEVTTSRWCGTGM